MNDQELEVKFYVHDLQAIELRARALGGELSQPRTHEVNLRFDTPDGELTRSARVLRLRQDAAARLTYKGPGYLQDEVRARQELEVVVSDFETTQRLLEALGYQVSLVYEKYRSIYELQRVHVTLDEMPFGAFVELEGPDGATIQAVAQRLGLDWAARITDSYTALFAFFKEQRQLEMRDLSFANFAGLEIAPEDLGLQLTG